MRMVPYMQLSTTITTIGRPCCTAVANSCPVIRKSPSPQNATTVRSGVSRFMATAESSPYPLEPDAEQVVPLRRQFPEAAAEQEDDVRSLHGREQLGIRTAAEVAGIARMQRIDDMGTTERGRDRDVETPREPHQRLARRFRPAAAA